MSKSKFNIRHIISRIIFYFAILLFCLYVVFPLYWLTMNAFRPMQDIMTWPPVLIPNRVSISNFIGLFQETKFSIFLRNSFIVASVSTLLTLFLTTLGGYSLTRFRYRGRDTIARVSLFTYMFPRIMICIPFFVLMTRLRLVDTYQGLILANTAVNIPFSLWLMRAFFYTIPIDLEESAMVDGATRFEAFYKVALPVAVPGLVSIGLIAFTWTWNELLFALTLISNEEFRTLPVGLSMFALKYGVIIHYILAGSFIFLVPPLIIFVLAQKYIVRGLAAGAVKG